MNLINKYATLITCLISASCSMSSPELIAHGGGEIDNHRYTNSLEAINKSVADGYRYIEIDFSITSDSVMVAAHDWRMFNRITGFEHKGDTAPTFADFSSRRIYDKYTPLSAADINKIFEKDTTIYLVTDKISSPELLSRNFPHLKKRMVVEAFSYEDYDTLCSEGYFRVMFSVLAQDFANMFLKHFIYSCFNEGHKIEWVVSDVHLYDVLRFKYAAKYLGLNIAIYTINDINELPSDIINDVDMIYTDKIKP